MADDQKVYNHRLGNYDVETEEQTDGAHRQVVSIKQGADTTTLEVKEEFSFVSNDLLSSILVEMKMIRTALGMILNEKITESDIEDNGL